MIQYFVTGGTVVGGSALVPVLLDDPGNEVCLLVRARDERALGERIDALFRFWQFGEREADVRRRVRAVRGDATEPRFGLAAADFDTLCATVTHVVHAAGAVRMNLPLEDARRSAVGSARQVVDFAWALHRTGRLEKVEFVSTVGVGGRLPVVREDWIDTPRDFHNTYEQSKAEAEELVHREVERGLPLTVHRPSMVVGDSRTGRIIHFQVFYHLCEFLSGRRTFGLFPPLGAARLDVVPADDVARQIAWSSRSPELAARLLHAAAGPECSLPLEALRQVVRATWQAHGVRVPRVVTLPRGVFGSIVRVAGRVVDERTRRALQTLPVFLDYLGTTQEFCVTRTAPVHGGGSQPSPAPCRPWQSFLPCVLDYYLRRIDGRRD